MALLFCALEANPARAQTYEVLHNFGPRPGINPYAALVADPLGNLYGTTYYGGRWNEGTVFRLDASSAYALTTLHSFSGGDGSMPAAALVLDSAGNLYGTTQSGGADGSGTVFKLEAANGYSLRTLHSFLFSDGDYPWAAVVFDAAGNLYGTTAGGGASNGGSVFKLDASRNYALTTLHSFRSPFEVGGDGLRPIAALVADASGNLYGTTSMGGAWGGGRVFKLDASNGYAFAVLHDFTGGSDGGDPECDLVIDSAGDLYGTTVLGTVFKLDASNGYALTTLHRFTDAEGTGSRAGLTTDASGNFYGTTIGGVFVDGHVNGGTVFKLDASNAYALTTLFYFSHDNFSLYRRPGLLVDSGGNLYGTTYGGGPAEFGTVFKLAATDGYRQSTLHAFDFVEGYFPTSSLTADRSGNIFGTTQYGGGGPSASGTIFKLDASKRYSLETVHVFSGADGSRPIGGLASDSAERLYGTTYEGGVGNGTVFRFDPLNGYSVTTLEAFQNVETGRGPTAGVIADSAGNLYGSTYWGGGTLPFCPGTCGTVFKLETSSGLSLTRLHTFNLMDGQNPAATLILDSAGSLYGTTERGGALGNGTVFKLDASNGYALTTLHSFTESDGWLPTGALVADSEGNLYGTAAFGGSRRCSDGCGTVFKLDASNAYSLTVLHSFDGSDGSNPASGLTVGPGGSFFGTARFGGASGYGTIFKVEMSGGRALTTLHNFAGWDGAFPVGGMTYRAGHLYGTAQQGGTEGTGVVFQFCLLERGLCSRSRGDPVVVRRSGP